VSAAEDQATKTLAWMRDHGDLLREVVREDLVEADDLTPGGDPNIRAHLRFVAIALRETLPAPVGERLEGFADALPTWFDESAPLFDAHLETGVGAIALEEHLQFGTLPGSDPSLDAGLERRVRIGGWIRIFLLGLEAHLGPPADGLGDQVLGHMGAHQRDLARLIFSLDLQAKNAAREAGGGGAVDLEAQDQIGQAAAVQGHMRLLVEAIADATAHGV
jgi:hypothetical protein